MGYWAILSSLVGSLRLMLLMLTGNNDIQVMRVSKMRESLVDYA